MVLIAVGGRSLPARRYPPGKQPDSLDVFQTLDGPEVGFLDCGSLFMLTPADILGPSGRIAARLPHYEQRPQQLEMADAVAGGHPRGRHLVAEAGTGVGKSFAYLVPAILAVADETQPFAGKPPATRGRFDAHDQPAGAAHRERPAAAEQRDPAGVLGRAGQRAAELRQPAAAAAGQRHARRACSQDEEFDAAAVTGRVEQEHDRRLAGRPADIGRCRRCGTKWTATAATAWAGSARRTRSASTIAPAGACRTRRSWSSTTRCSSAIWRCGADGASILPDYDVVIFDEAHTLEAVAGDHLGVNLTSGQIEYMLAKLYNDRTQRGLLVHHRLAEAQQRGAGLPLSGRRVLRRRRRLARTAGTGKRRVSASRRSSRTS